MRGARRRQRGSGGVVRLASRGERGARTETEIPKVHPPVAVLEALDIDLSIGSLFDRKRVGLTAFMSRAPAVPRIAFAHRPEAVVLKRSQDLQKRLVGLAGRSSPQAAGADARPFLTLQDCKA